MALDTVLKRRSATGVGRPWLRAHGLDASAGIAWRQNTGLSYAGNAVGVIPAQPIAPVRQIHRLRPSWVNGFAGKYDSEKPHLWDGLIAGWLPQLGATGNTIRDFAGNAHATLTNHTPASVWYPNGRDLGILSDGIDDYASFSSGSVLDSLSSTQSFTISTFWNLHGPSFVNGDEMYLFRKTHNDTNASFRLMIDETEPKALFLVKLADSSGQRVSWADVGASPGDDIVNQWVRITGVYERYGGSSTLDALHIYGDRDLKATTTFSSAIGGVLHGAGLGEVIGTSVDSTRWSPKGEWGGTLVWDRVLSVAEIGELVDDPICLVRPRVEWPGASVPAAFQPSETAYEDGWDADSRTRVWNPVVRSRVWTAIGRSRVWTAPEDST